MLIYESILRDEEVNYEYCLFVGPVSIYSGICVVLPSTLIGMMPFYV
jgi:uncharacterized membrane protein